MINVSVCVEQILFQVYLLLPHAFDSFDPVFHCTETILSFIRSEALIVFTFITLLLLIIQVLGEKQTNLAHLAYRFLVDVMLVD